MFWPIVKILISACVISFASWLSNKKPELAGFIIALGAANSGDDMGDTGSLGVAELAILEVDIVDDLRDGFQRWIGNTGTEQYCFE